VEDDPSFLGLVETILAERGYHVFTSADGIDAWPLIRVHRPHLLILDLNLPGIGGLELLMRLRGHPDTAATPVLVCSGAVADLRALESRLRQLHCAVLAKPFELDELERTLQQLVPDFPAPQL
jgi:CheY-like chemotaxis protein